MAELGFLDKCADLSAETDVIAAYRKALKRVAPDAFASPNEHVIQKTPGLFSLHKLLAHLVPVMFTGRQDWTVENVIDSNGAVGILSGIAGYVLGGIQRKESAEGG